MKKSLDYTLLPVASRAKLASQYSLEEIGITTLLLMFCAEQINGGIIPNFSKLTKKQLLIEIGLDKKLTKDCPGLWHFEGCDLHVDFYDRKAESAVLSKRETYSNNAKARWDSTCNGNAIAHPIANANADAMAEEVLVEVEDKVKGGRGNTTVVLGDAPATSPPPPPDDSSNNFDSWLLTLKAAIPALAEYSRLPDAVLTAARAAYSALPNATDYAPLLTAYYADTKLNEDSDGKKFWRPSGDHFFAHLSDVIHKHAERWGKYTGWLKRQKRAQKSTDPPPKPPPPAAKPVTPPPDTPDTAPDAPYVGDIVAEVATLAAKITNSTPKPRVNCWTRDSLSAHLQATLKTNKK